MHADTESGFTFDLKNGERLDILDNNKIVGRFMLAYDVSTKERKHETYKPYLHIFDARGTAPITKGAGGEFTHHRGIFIGWNKIGCNKKNYDRWHMSGGEQVVQGAPLTNISADAATITATVHWNDEAGQPLLVEKRTMTFRRAPAPAYALIDFQADLTAKAGDITLDGDPEHAGIQFRPANEVDRAKTTYLYAGEAVNPHQARDLAWIGETFTLKGSSYSVVQMNHPDNPAGTRISAYRNYGRFGMFPTASIKAGETRTLRYRFLVAEGVMPPLEVIQSLCNAFTGRADPVPPVTAKAAE
ncbi:MAG: PmoA family protein [Kiritimatiellae bacterium]|nr:PmoA family protein [Kiritimatiellia bacterium]